ncbi:MFS transporter [Candidatus Omnitrophota bacterium]
MPRLRDILRERNFSLLWCSQIVSQFGDKFTQMALVGLINKRAPGSTYELAKLFIFVIIPVFIVGPMAGVFSDRWSRKYTMVISDLIRGSLVLSIAAYWMLVPSLKPVFPIYIIVFIIFSVTRFFIPAKMSIIPDLVPEDGLLQANSLMHTTGMIAASLGYGLGGIVIALPMIGVKGGLLIDGVTFFLSALLVIFIKVRIKPPAFKKKISVISKQIKEAVDTSVLIEIKEGIKYLVSQRKMHFLIELLFFLWSGVGATYVVMITFIQGTLQSVTKDLGLLIMFFGGGLFLGSIIYGKFGRSFDKVKAIFLSLALGGVFMVQFVVFVGASQRFSIAAILASVFGCALAPIMISSNTIVHELIPDDLRGRVFASLEAVMHLAFLVFMIISAILAEVFSGFYILLIIGMLFIYFGVHGLKRRLHPR